jgi:hypothetical protein
MISYRTDSLTQLKRRADAASAEFASFSDGEGGLDQNIYFQACFVRGQRDSGYEIKNVMLIFGK